jgi:hypothetical protein
MHRGNVIGSADAVRDDYSAFSSESENDDEHWGSFPPVNSQQAGNVCTPVG